MVLDLENYGTLLWPGYHTRMQLSVGVVPSMTERDEDRSTEKVIRFFSSPQQILGVQSSGLAYPTQGILCDGASMVSALGR